MTLQRAGHDVPPVLLAVSVVGIIVASSFAYASSAQSPLVQEEPAAKAPAPVMTTREAVQKSIDVSKTSLTFQIATLISLLGAVAGAVRMWTQQQNVMRRLSERMDELDRRMDNIYDPGELREVLRNLSEDAKRNHLEIRAQTSQFITHLLKTATS